MHKIFSIYPLLEFVLVFLLFFAGAESESLFGLSKDCFKVRELPSQCPSTGLPSLEEPDVVLGCCSSGSLCFTPVSCWLSVFDVGSFVVLVGTKVLLEDSGEQSLLLGETGK